MVLVITNVLTLDRTTETASPRIDDSSCFTVGALWSVVVILVVVEVGIDRVGNDLIVWFYKFILRLSFKKTNVLLFAFKLLDEICIIAYEVFKLF